MKWNVKNRLLIFWMATYSLIGIVSIIAMIFSYNISSKQIYDRALAGNQTSLLHIKDTMDENFDSLEKVVIMSGRNEKLCEMAQNTKPIDALQLYNMGELESILKDYSETLRWVDEAFYYFKNQNRIVTSDSTIDDEDFYRMLGIDCTYEEWKKLLTTDTGNFLVEVKDKTGNECFLYVAANYFRRSFKTDNMSFCALLRREDLDFIYEDMQLILENKITDERVCINGNFLDRVREISENRGVVEISGEDYIYSVLASDVWGIDYVGLTSRRELFSEFNKLTRIHFCLFLIVIMISGVMSYWFARRNSMGLTDVLNVLGENVSSVNGFDIFRKVEVSIRNIIQNYTTTMENNLEQLNKLKDRNFIHLCVNPITNIEVREKELYEYGIDFPYSGFSVMVVYPQTEENLTLYAYALKNIVQSMLEKQCKFLMSEKDCLVVFILNYERDKDSGGMPMELMAAWEQVVEIVQEGIGYRLGEKVYYEMSDATDSLTSIPDLYREVLSKLDDKIAMDDVMEGVTNGRNAQLGSGGYSNEVRDRRLRNAICDGDDVTAFQIIYEMFFELKNNKELSRFGLRCFVYDMFCTLLYAAFDIGEEAVEYMYNYYFSQHIEQKTLEREYRKLTIDCAKGLCRIALPDSKEKVPANRGDRLEQKITEYIYENYADFDMGLQKIADYLHMNSAYVSSSFKEQCGEGIQERLEKYRMMKAVEFLEHGEKVSEVAKMVGYQNVRTFSKAFKRNYGVSPSKF
ncbi:MAG: helix-turn-helix transcriptional regulator [Clostridia bacterium]|nr:helix-turn-helix transcriptional regulator [Clostridia bacterium]